MNDLKRQLIELYKKSFDESADYADYFFNRRYKEENVVAVSRGGKVISALHLIPQRIMLDGKAVSAGYITSAATLPEYRGKGIFPEVLAKTEKVLSERGMKYVFLYPFKHEYYIKHGFIEYSYIKTRVAGIFYLPRQPVGCHPFVPKGNSSAVIITEHKPGDKKTLRLIMDAYERLCGDFEGWVVRDGPEWEYRFGEIWADGGNVLAVQSGDNKRIGYVMLNKGRIEECCFTDFTEAEQDAARACMIDGVTEAAGMEYGLPVRKTPLEMQNCDSRLYKPFGMIKKTGGTAAETFEIFKNKSCVLFDKY